MSNKTIVLGILFAGLAAGPSVARAETAVANGDWKGGDAGSWGVATNWKGDALPTSSARFWPSNDQTIDVSLDGGDYSAATIALGPKTSVFYGDHRPTLRLTGPGSLTATSSCGIYNDLNLVFDNIRLSANELYYYYTNVLEIRNGSAVTSPGALHVRNHNTIAVSDSSVTVGGMSLDKDVLLTLTNATLTSTGNSFTLGEGSSLSYVDSRINTAAQYIASPDLLPQGSSVLDAYASARPPIALATGDGVSYSFDGTLLATNGTFQVDGGRCSFGGGGSLYAKVFTVPNSTSEEIDLRTLGIGSQLYSFKENQNTRLTMYGPLTLASFGDWESVRQAHYDVAGDLTVDTLDCFDGATTHTFTLRGLYPHAGASLVLKGGGSGTVGFNDSFCRWRSVELKDGTDLAFFSTPLTYSYSAYPRLFASDLAVGAGSTVSVTANDTVIDVTGLPSFASGATLSVAPPATLVAGRRYPALVAPVAADLSALAVTATSTPEGWSLVKSNGCVFFTDGSTAPKRTAYEWTGASGANMNDAGNWYGGEVPPAKSGYNECPDVYFSGNANCQINNDLTMGDKFWRRLIFRDGGPWRISGGEMRLHGVLGERTVMNYADLPVQIDCDITHTMATYASFISYSNSYVRLNGTTSIKKAFLPSGDIRVGGALTCGRLRFERSYGTSQFTRLTVCNGGAVTVLNQDASDAITAEMLAGVLVEGGASMTIAGGAGYSVGYTAFKHLVNGRFDCRVPFSATKDHVFDGTGRVDIASVKSTAANATMTLRGGLRLVPAAWPTVTSDDADHFARLLVETRATLGATNDWTYGPAAGVSPATTAASRALLVPTPLSALTVDTQDPATGAGHAITFADPIIGYGSVVKTGAGTLVLASDANAITGGVRVVSGALGWRSSQRLPKLAVSAGGELRFGSANGAVAKLTVGSDVDLTGVTVAPLDATARAALTKSFVTVLEAADGAKLTGVPADSRGCGIRIVDGCKLQVMAARNGVALIIR